MKEEIGVKELLARIACVYWCKQAWETLSFQLWYSHIDHHISLVRNRMEEQMSIRY